MKVLLRNPATGMFYAGDNKWTKHRSEALDFERTNLALDCVSEWKLKQVEVLMDFEEPPFEIPMKVIDVATCTSSE